MKLKEGRTLYARDPQKNYQFVKVGEIGIWRTRAKYIRLNGKLYTMTLVE